MAIASLTHTFVGDLQIDLTSPDGTTVRLFDQHGGGEDNLINTVFSDAATTPIAAGTAPFTGSFIPVQPLSTFKGEPSGGLWRLTVRSLGVIDVGTLNNWSIALRRFGCP